MTTQRAEVLVLEGDARSNVVLHVPHAGLRIPADVRVGIDLTTDELRREVVVSADGGTAALARTAAYRAQPSPWIVENGLSRLVIDPERFLEGDPMEAFGRGVVATTTHDGRALREEIASERAALVERYAVPYAALVERVVVDRLAAVGSCLLIDVHSYPKERWAVEPGPLDAARPEICIGTSDQTPAALRAMAVDVFTREGFDVDLNTPYAGAYVPLSVLADERVRSVMVEVRKDVILLDGVQRVRRDGMLRVVTALQQLIESGPVTIQTATGSVTP